MKAYKPSSPFSTTLFLLIPQSSMVLGVEKKVFPEGVDGIEVNGSFKTYGGTESEENGIYSVIDTAVIETWFRPDIKSNCRIFVPLTGGTYEIISEPENINLRNQYLKFKVRRIKGGA